MTIQEAIYHFMVNLVKECGEGVTSITLSNEAYDRMFEDLHELTRYGGRGLPMWGSPVTMNICGREVAVHRKDLPKMWPAQPGEL